MPKPSSENHQEKHPANGAIVALNSGLALPLTGLPGIDVIRWLEAALPVYERSRGQLARQAVMIGYALICVRDFGPRGSLAALKKMQVFAASERTLNRCIKAAQLYAESRGLLTAKGQLAEVSQPETLFQPEFDFSDPGAHPLALDIADYVGDATLKDLIERDALEDDDREPPQGHQRDSAKKRPLQETAAQKRTAYLKALQNWHAIHGQGHWRHLPVLSDAEGRTVGTVDLEGILRAALQAVEAHNKDQAAKERSKP